MKIKVNKSTAPILRHSINPLAKDLFWAYHPVVLENKGTYYMFYTGKSLKKGIAHHMLLAKSLDLKHWNKYKDEIIKAGEATFWDSDFLAHAYVFADDNKFEMLYDGSRLNDWLEEIGLAESSDLIHWKKYKKNPILKVGKNWWEKRHVSRCCIYKENGIYYLYYAGHDGERERIGIARGKSLTFLKRISKDPVLDLGKKGDWDGHSISDPRVFKLGNKYLMFYSGIDSKSIERMGMALSVDLIHWEKYDKNPILDVSKNSWDSISASRADIKKFGDRFYIFYSGRKNRFFYNIGMAEVEIS